MKSSRFTVERTKHYDSISNETYSFEIVFGLVVLR